MGGLRKRGVEERWGLRGALKEERGGRGWGNLLYNVIVLQ